MKKTDFLLSAACGILVFAAFCDSALSEPALMETTILATLRDENGRERGVAGPFVGRVAGKLVIAGGSNFPDKPLWQGGEKRFYDTIRILGTDKDGSFQWVETAIRLPEPGAGGASVTVDDVLYLFGGSNTEGTTDRCLKLAWNGETGQPEIFPLPKLPEPLSFSAAAAHNGVVYLAGGYTDEKSGAVSNRFLALDLKQSGTDRFAWRTLPSWGGPARALSVCAIQNDGDGKAFYLFGGRGADASGRLVEWGDAWRYRIGTGGWSPVENIDKTPFHFAAATAAAAGTSHILFFGHAGSKAHRELLDEPGGDFPGFSNEIHAFNVVTNKMFLLGRTAEPLPLVTPSVSWQGGFVLASGESGPGRRSSAVLQIKLPQDRNRLGVLNIVVMAGYFGLMLWMGFYFAKRQKNTEDYFRAANRIPWWIIGISIFGTSTSSISYMAVPAKSFVTNWSYLLISVAVFWAAPVVTLVLIPRLRKYDLTSAYEYLERRFSLTLRLIGSLVFMLFQVARMAVMLFLPAIALNVVTNVDIYVCIVVIGVVSLVYTLYGGIEAVIWTDVLQVVILMGGLVTALVIALAHLDMGLAESVRIAASEHKLSLGSPEFDLREPTISTLLIASFFLYLIPFSSDQAIVQRYFMSRTDREAAGGLWVNALIALPGAVMLFALGTVLYLFYRQNPTELSVSLNSNDSLFPWFIITRMPPGVSGLVIVAIFAAAMSSLSASVNAISAAFTVDFHQRLFSRTGAPSLFCAKAATLVGGLAGIFLALAMVAWDISSFWDEYNRLMGLISSGLAGLFFLGVLSKRANAPGALVGLSTGIVVQLLVMRYKSVHLLLYAGIGFTVCISVGYLASLCFPSRANP